jgi:segregation and condensation protein B
MKLMEIQHVKRIVEAALLAAGQPLNLIQLSALFTENEPVGSEGVAQALAELQADCAERGVELVEVASGFRYQVRQDVHPFVSRMWTERQTRYSRALLETLALIAYRQPITRAEIEQIRGVVVSTGIIRTLEEREWVRVVGHRDVPGRPALFGTTRQFLDYFNLKSLDALPPLAEIRDLEELEPQLQWSDAGLSGPPLLAIDAPDDAGGDASHGSAMTGADPAADATLPDAPDPAPTRPPDDDAASAENPA